MNDPADDRLERHLSTMLRERAATVPERVPVDRVIVTRAYRRRNVKRASFVSGFALGAAVVVVAVLSVAGSPVAKSKQHPVSPSPSVHLSTPPSVSNRTGVPVTSSRDLEYSPLSARAASATVVSNHALVVWGGAGERGA